jgi:hypothetical protein
MAGGFRDWVRRDGDRSSRDLQNLQMLICGSQTFGHFGTRHDDISRSFV